VNQRDNEENTKQCDLIGGAEWGLESQRDSAVAMPDAQELTEEYAKCVDELTLSRDECKSLVELVTSTMLNLVTIRKILMR
jgi:hypothetical protein